MANPLWGHCYFILRQTLVNPPLQWRKAIPQASASSPSSGSSTSLFWPILSNCPGSPLGNPQVDFHKNSFRTNVILWMLFLSARLCFANVSDKQNHGHAPQTHRCNQQSGKVQLLSSDYIRPAGRICFFGMKTLWRKSMPLSVCLSIYPSVYLSTIRLSIKHAINQSIYLSFYLSISW